MTDEELAREGREWLAGQMEFWRMLDGNRGRPTPGWHPDGGDGAALAA